MRTLMLGILATFLFLSFFSISAAAYQVSYYTSNTTGGASTLLHQPSMLWNNTVTCVQEITPFITQASASSYDVSIDYYSPGTTIIGTSSQTGLSNIVCQNFGQITDSDTGLQSGVFVTESGTGSGFVFLQTRYTCTTSDDDFTYFVNRDDNSTNQDGKGFYPGALVTTSESSLPIITQESALGNFSTCEITNSYTSTRFEPTFDFACSIANDPCGVVMNFPFNTSESGSVNIFVDLNDTFSCFGHASSPFKNFNVSIVKDSDQTATNLYTFRSVCSGAPFDTDGVILNQSFTLPKNEIYNLVFESEHPSTGFSSDMGVRPPGVIKIDVDARIPDFECGEFNTCINGTQSRECIDQTGIFPNEIEFQDCFDLVAESSQVIGFEESEDFTFLECKKDPFFCTASPQNIVIEVPVNWTSVVPTVNSSSSIVPAARLAYMTSEDSSNGFKSLLMVYNPPQYDFVVENAGGAHLPAVCGNGSTGYIPQVYGDVNNASNIIFTDITFPTPYITVAWDVALRTEPVVKYSTGNFLCSPSELCYAQDCNQTPRGEYLVRLAPTSDIFNTIFEYNGEATEGFDSVQVDLSDANLDAGTSYRLIFALNPDDAYEPDGYTVLFDNVRFSNFNNPPGNPELGCTTFCNGTDLYTAIDFNNTCTFEIDLNNTVCTTEYEATQQAEAIAESTDPVAFFADALNVTAVEDSGFGFALFFLSPIFLFFGVIIFIGGFIEYKIAKNSGTSGARGGIFGMILIMGTVFVTMAFPEFIGFAIVLIIISGFIVVNSVMKGFGGG